MGKVRLRDLNPAIFLHKVGIGTDNPAELLDVVGGNVRIGKTTNGRLTIENSSGTAKVQLDSNGVSYINGGNFGVGTAIPGAKVEIYDSTINSADLLFLKTEADSVDDYVGLKFAGGTDGNGATLALSAIRSYGGPSAGDSYLALLTSTDSDGSNVLVKGLIQDHQGNIGIGTGSSAPETKLHVRGAYSSGRIPHIRSEDSTDSSFVQMYMSNSSGGYLETSSGKMLRFAPAGSTKMVILTDGKVGINSTNPNARLVVAGNSDAGDSACAIHIIDNDSTSGSSVPNISFRSGASTQIYQIRGNDTLGLTFRNSSDTTKICFDDDGNIGVGINQNISAKLQVEGGRIKVRQSDSYSGFSIAHESGGYAYLINSDNTYMTFMVGGSASSNQILTLQDEKIELNREAQFKGTTRLDPRNGGHHIIETAFNLNNHNSSTGESYNIADITRDINNWGYGHYIVEVHANYYSGGSYARYYIIYAASNSEVKTIDSAVGANTGYNVYLAGETTLSGNVKKASIMVDVPAYGNATVKLTHCGVSVDTGSLSHLSGRIKYNI